MSDVNTNSKYVLCQYQFWSKSSLEFQTGVSLELLIWKKRTKMVFTWECDGNTFEEKGMIEDSLPEGFTYEIAK